MPNDRPLYEQILDVALYAPIGAVVTAAEQVPALVGKGRSAVEGQVTVARMIGRMTVGMARKKVDDVVSSRWASPPSPTASAEPEEAPPAAREPDAASSRATAARVAVDVPKVETLAIPGYDSLAASQVVPRLEGLSPEELDAVLAYEEATRRRRTIIGRIHQLRGGGSPQ